MQEKLDMTCFKTRTGTEYRDWKHLLLDKRFSTLTNHYKNARGI